MWSGKGASLCCLLRSVDMLGFGKMDITGLGKPFLWGQPSRDAAAGAGRGSGWRKFWRQARFPERSPRRCVRLLESCLGHQIPCCDPCATCYCRFFNAFCYCRKISTNFPCGKN
uniref:Agouti domain-containing protein n=1 Tax=Anas platyrhynchos platyrhynchos TaxID=8840 RepID=A0A493T0J4_ANAPP